MSQCRSTWGRCQHSIFNLLIKLMRASPPQSKRQSSFCSIQAEHLVKMSSPPPPPAPQLLSPALWSFPGAAGCQSSAPVLQGFALGSESCFSPTVAGEQQRGAGRSQQCQPHSKALGTLPTPAGAPWTRFLSFENHRVERKANKQ